MPPRQQYFAILMALILLLVVFELVRRHKMKIEYSWLWLLTSIGILLLVIRYDFLEWLTNAIGAVLPTTTVFIFAVVFLILLMIHFSVKTTSFDNQIKKLTQELALLKNQIENQKNTDDNQQEEKPDKG